ncbi:unnamed protein product [Linum trigynum]|uniref:Uncharacterized protein n=1 Tax=Linum trigynum TaxID=586398 RepID=A0AAV2FSS0_9ROSI
MATLRSPVPELTSKLLFCTAAILVDDYSPVNEAGGPTGVVTSGLRPAMREQPAPVPLWPASIPSSGISIRQLELAELEST